MEKSEILALYNGKHLIRVIDSIEMYPDQWVASSLETDKESWRTYRDSLWSGQHHLPSWGIVWRGLKVAPDTQWNEENFVEWLRVCDVAFGTLSCMLAFDDCSYMLYNDPDEIKVLAALGDTRATLMLPATNVFYSAGILEQD